MPRLSVFEKRLDNDLIRTLLFGQPSVTEDVGLGDHHRSLPNGRVYPTAKQIQKALIGSEWKVFSQSL